MCSKGCVILLPNKHDGSSPSVRTRVQILQSDCLQTCKQMKDWRTLHTKKPCKFLVCGSTAWRVSVTAALQRQKVKRCVDVVREHQRGTEDPRGSEEAGKDEAGCQMSA
uniref:Uncharacterized protein n=3 Tax=Nothobranchius TaxID=28779 RepID=A0A1A8U4J9_NOTFU